MALSYRTEVAMRSLVAPLYLATRWASGGRAHPDEALPRVRMTAGLAAKVALDEVFFTAEMVSMPIASPGERRRMRREVFEALNLFANRGWLDEPERYHRAPPPLRDPVFRDARARKLPYRMMEFDSGYAPHAGEPGRERWLSYEENRIAHAMVFQHPGPPRPWLMCIHGYRMGVPRYDLYGFRVRWLHEKLGLNVILPILPLHGPRTVGWRSGDGFLSGDFVDTLHVQAQAMWDLRRMLSWMWAQGAPAIGLHGLSLGGYTASLLAGLEPGLRCIIAGIPATDFVRLVYRQVPVPFRWLSELIGLDWDNAAEMMQVVSPLALRPRVPFDGRFLFAGVADRLVAAEDVLELWRHWDQPRLLWYEGGHVSFRMDREVKRLLREALDSTGMLSGARQAAEAATG